MSMMSADSGARPRAAEDRPAHPRVNEELFFANADPLRERLLALTGASDLPVHTVVLEMGGELDMPVVYALADLHENLAQRRVRQLLSRVRKQVRETLDRGGVADHIGETNTHRQTFVAAMAHTLPTGDGPCRETSGR
jgi:MFS superfamily sulfate permease-like transporter